MKKLSSKRKLMLGLLGTMGAAALITVPAVTLSSCGTTTSTNVTELKAPTTINESILSGFKLGDKVIDKSKITFTPSTKDASAKFKIVDADLTSNIFSFEYSTIFNNANFGESNGFDKNFSVAIAEVANAGSEKFNAPTNDDGSTIAKLTTKENAAAGTYTFSLLMMYENDENNVTVTGSAITFDIELATANS